MKIIEKGWMVDLTQIEEGYLYASVICTAKTRGEAKHKILKSGDADDMILRCSSKVVTFTTLPVIRCKSNDIVEYNGEKMTVTKMERKKALEEHNNKLKAILNNDYVTHCYIKKRGDYYCDNYCGYTSFRFNAGVYTKEDAVSAAIGCTELTIVPIDNVEHNQYLDRKIDEIKERMIK